MGEILFVDCLHIFKRMSFYLSECRINACVHACTFARVSVLTHWRLVVAEHSADVVVFEQRTKHLGTHLVLPPQRHVGSDHFVVCVQVVTGGGEDTDRRHSDTEVRSSADRCHHNF